MLTWTKSGISLDPDWSWSVGNWYQKSLYVSLVKTEKTEKLLSFLSIFLKFETSSLTFAPMIVSFSTYFWLKLSFEKSSTSVGVKTLKTRFLVKMPTVQNDDNRESYTTSSSVSHVYLCQDCLELDNFVSQTVILDTT